MKDLPPHENRRLDRRIPLGCPAYIASRDGSRIPALASIGKTAWLFILNRETGAPVFGVREMPVPQGDVPGEWYAPTQPVPVRPAQPFARVCFPAATCWSKAGPWH